MRKQMFKTVSKIVETDLSATLLLADIGAMGFSKLLNMFPMRAMNIGIFEDGMISVAAGLALRGLNPIIYGITPFIVQRALEQLKLDFAYQKLNGNFITTGAAYDFSTLGYSHYCPEDFETIRTLPGFDFIAPGTGTEFEQLFMQCYNNGNPTYYRLSDYPNKIHYNVVYGQANLICKGTKATIVVVSTMLELVLEACKQRDVTILYYTTLVPFDRVTLLHNCPSRKVLVVEPHYKGGLLSDIFETLSSGPIEVRSVGIPRQIIRTYGTKLQKDEHLGFTVSGIQTALDELIG